MKNIKYVFIGNSLTAKEIGDYPSKANEAWVKDTKQIFEKYCKSPMTTKIEQRNRVVGNDGNYYFTITPSNIFYLILAGSEYPERQVFEMIEAIQKENIPILVDEKGLLNKLGKQSLKNLVDGYQNPTNNQISNVNNDINEIKDHMRTNVVGMAKNLGDLEELKQVSDSIKINSQNYKKEANDLKTLTCWQNCKWTIILIILIIGVLLVIIVPIAVSFKGASTASSAIAGSSSAPANSTNSTSAPSGSRFLI